MTGTVWTPPPVVGVEATLVAACRLLNNPPSTHTSPSVVEQWCHDVDQLIVVAINSRQHEGGWQEPAATHSRSPSVVRAPPSARVPHQVRVLLSIATTDLHDELIRRGRGEDSRITIECHCERCHNIEQNFESLVLAREAPTARAMHPPSSPTCSGVYGACTTSPDGGLAVQILAPPTSEV
jgi:hypothetical protein